MIRPLASLLSRLATRLRHRDNTRAVERACGLDASTAQERARRTAAAVRTGRTAWPFRAE